MPVIHLARAALVCDVGMNAGVFIVTVTRG